MLILKATMSRAKIFAWLVLLLLIPAIQVKAQKYFFDNYSVKQGLGEQKVYTLLQDSRDNIWLGTANGLSRFDGKDFVNFTTRDSLAPGGVKCITEDASGNIWFGHLNGGISRFNGRFFERAVIDSVKVTGDITGINQLNGLICFTSYGSGAVMTDFPVKDIRKIKVRQFTGKDNLSDLLIGSAVIGDTSLICIASEGFLRRYSIHEKKFENFRLPHYTTYFATTCLVEDLKGNIWFGTYNGGIYKYVMSESRMDYIDLPKAAGIPSNWISCISEDSKGRMWVGTWGAGIALIEDSTIRKYDSGNGLVANRIYSIIEDAEDNILIADQSNGLSIFKGDAFLTFNSEQILPDPNVNAIYQDKSGALWFGTNAGISRYSPGSGKPPVIYDRKSGVLFDNVGFFREDKSGNLWIGTKDGVLMYDMKLQKFEAMPYVNSSLPKDPQVTALEIDSRNNLWIGTVEGIAAGLAGGQDFVRRISLDSVTIATTPITALYNDPLGNMWIGTEPSGSRSVLFCYSPEKDKFRKIPALHGVKPFAMTMDKAGILWIGTSEGLKGLRNDSIVININKNDGLLSDIINIVAVADDGSILAGTNTGLNRYFPESKRIFSYTERNGYTGIESNRNAVYRSPSGEFWFGTANGAIRMDPAKTATEELEPLTHLLGMQVNYKTHEMVPGMKLSYSERTILFDYYSICVTNPDVVRYKVMLEGADNDWQPVTDQTRVTYPSLAPGRYVFKVIASNSQGVWNREPVTFSFIVKPPFYLTWWFIIAVILLAVIAIVAYIKIREKNLIREKIILEEKVEERTAEVVQKSMEIEEKNRDITASIRYAERIQRAMLPREDSISETFVLFMPKDIVSGDFYWMYGDGDREFIAVCDCTGHGVPGAFMSIIGHNSLHKVVREYGIVRPAAILDHLNTEVLKALRQRNEETINDGMDMALIAFDKKNFSLHFAGAYNPLYVVRNGEVMVYKGDRFPIGMTAISEKKSFANQEVDIRPGDMLYMCSDGYADQFGSEEGKKYKSGNVKKLLAEIWLLPVDQQRKRLEDEILRWKGDLPQIDDILFVGTRIPQN